MGRVSQVKTWDLMGEARKCAGAHPRKHRWESLSYSTGVPLVPQIGTSREHWGAG